MKSFVQDNALLAKGLTRFAYSCKESLDRAKVKFVGKGRCHIYPIGFNVQLPATGVHLGMNLANMDTGEVLEQINSGLIFRNQEEMESALDIFMPLLQDLLQAKKATMP